MAFTSLDSLQRSLLAASVGALALVPGGCTEQRVLREWLPSDHPAPAAITPEGQGAAQEEGDPTARAALALWSIRCASCHGETGRGDGAGKPPGAPVPDMGQASFQSARTDAQLAEVINKGRGLMPAFGEQVTPEGVVALVAHVRSLGGR